MNRSSYAFVATIIVALMGAPVAAYADDQDVIDYREHVMNSLSEQAAALGQILSGAIPDDNLVAHMDAIATVAATALKSFEPKVPGGEAKPEVWNQWPDFSKRMNEFVQKTAEMAKIAKTQGKEEAVAKAMDALTCKSCHNVYRLEKKK
jgi:cytochrome c556